MEYVLFSQVKRLISMSIYSRYDSLKTLVFKSCNISISSEVVLIDRRVEPLASLLEMDVEF